MESGGIWDSPDRPNNNYIINAVQSSGQVHLLSFSERLLKILIIGNSGVGKSCMLMRYVENNFTTAFYNTIGVDFVAVD